MASTINLLRLLADPTRVRLLLLLEQEEFSVAELQQILGMGQSRISSHLAQLKRAGVVSDRRVGKNMYYGANHHGRNSKRERVEEITRLLARELPETSRDRTSLKLVLHKRQDKARKYFDELAGKFGRSYVPGRSWKALAHTLITLLPPLTVADLGAGEGTLSQLLAKKARKVIAVDNSPKMVEFGSELAKKHGFNNLEYRLGDIQDPPIAKNSINLAILSQALHHAIHPERTQSRFMRGFFEEVKRRKVYRVAAAYLIAGGAIIQLASAAFPAWELPNWALRLVIVLLLIGFPIALLLAWAFDLTVQGIKAAPTTGAVGSHMRRNVITLVAAGVVVSAAAGFFLLPRVSAHKVDKSIAVLPFEGLSDEKENAYFADGIQDDVLTNLSKVGDLKVISRTSVMPYRGKTSNVREI